MNTMQVIVLVAALGGTGFAVMFLHALAVERHSHRLVTPLVAVTAGIATWLVYFGLVGLYGGGAAPASSWALLAVGISLYTALVARTTLRTNPAMGAVSAIAFLAVGVAAGAGLILLAVLMFFRGLFRMAPAIAEESEKSMQDYQARQVRDAAVARALGSN